jgi:hypothetical protein
MRKRKALLMMTASFAAMAAYAQSGEPISSPTRTDGDVFSATGERVRATAELALPGPGYIEKLQAPPRVDYVLEQLAQRRLQLQKNGAAETPAALGFHEFSIGEPWPIANIDIKKIPESIVAPDSKNYLIRGNPIKQIYTSTRFGSLIIDQQPKARLRLDAPNLSIAGHPATFTYVKYRGNAWATIIYATDGDATFMIEANRRLEGTEKESFIQFADELISP